EVAHVSTRGKPPPLVPKELVGEIVERMDYKGSVVVELDHGQAERVIDQLVAKGIESLAVSLLWSFANDSHERAIAEILAERYQTLYHSLSSEVAPFLGEYERSITTIFNAYIGPPISSYLARLRDLLVSRGLQREPLIMQAYGGVLGVDASSKNAIGTIESGPAAGVVGCRFLGEVTREQNILATDMGGTTFKV